MRHRNTGYITRCRTKRSQAGNMMTSFRLFPDSPTYYIAMHRDVKIPWKQPPRLLLSCRLGD